MHAYDARQNLEWVVHLIGKVLLSAWAGGLLAFALSLVLWDARPLTIFWFVWPAAVGIWLVFSNAPEPTLLDEDEEEAEAHPRI